MQIRAEKQKAGGKEIRRDNGQHISHYAPAEHHQIQYIEKDRKSGAQDAVDGIQSDHSSGPHKLVAEGAHGGRK